MMGRFTLAAMTQSHNPDTRSPVVLKVSGMTCSHCIGAVQRIMLAQPGVSKATVRLANGRATLEVDNAFDLDRLNQALAADGYAAATAVAGDSSAVWKRSAQAGAALVIILALVLFSRPLGHLVKGVHVTETMTLGLVFLIGLVASVSSCMAITGGLLLAIASKLDEAMVGQGTARRLLPHLAFNAGRILSYTAFGALIGWLGASLTLSPTASAAVTLVASALMIAIGLQMLGVTPPITDFLRISDATTSRMHRLVASRSTVAAFVLGAGTFFLPCGFTLALQLYVLARGDALQGAMTMLVFALGTLPALLSLSAVAFVGARIRGPVLRFAGAAIVVLGAFNIQFGLVQLASGEEPVVPFVAEAGAQRTAAQPAQVVEMKIDGLSYEPNRFTVKVGVPVEWRIDAREAEGCGRILVARAIGIAKFLSADKPEVITFTPLRTGEIAFNCSMGMMTPGSGFTVVN